MTKEGNCERCDRIDVGECELYNIADFVDVSDERLKGIVGLNVCGCCRDVLIDCLHPFISHEPRKENLPPNDTSEVEAFIKAGLRLREHWGNVTLTPGCPDYEFAAAADALVARRKERTNGK